MISEEDIEKLASAARDLPPSASVYVEEDFVMNLLETVLDYMLQTEVVVRALEHFRENRWDEVRSLDDLDQLVLRFPEDQAGNTALAQHLWGYNLWTRAQQLRELARFRSELYGLHVRSAEMEPHPDAGFDDLVDRLRETGDERVAGPPGFAKVLVIW